MTAVANTVFVIEGSHEPQTGQGIYTDRVLAQLKQPITRISLNGGCKSVLGRIVYSLAMVLYLSIRVGRNDSVYWLMSRSRGALYREAILARVLRRHGARVVVHLHGNELDKTIQQIPARVRTVLVTSLRKFTVIVLCDCIAKRVAEQGIEGRVHVIGNTIENQFGTAPVTAPARLPDKHVRLLYLSNLLPEKGILDAIDALDALNARQYLGRAWSLDVAGGWGGVSDADRARIAERMANTDAVNYHGFVVADHKRQIFEDADIFLFPSRYKTEAFPLSLIEALLAGVPIVARPIGCIPDMVAGCPHVDLIDLDLSLDQALIAFAKRLSDGEVMIDTTPAFRMVGEDGPEAICGLIQCTTK